MNRIKSLIAFTLLQLTMMTTPQGLQAQVDPRIEWKEIETDSAYWLFDANHQEAAEYYILQFESAKQQVLPLFKEASRKMTILLVDNTDSANGSAQVSPHPIISLNMVRPSANSSIGEFRDPINELLVHEYTHILNMEPVHGFMSPLYWIFGSVAHPNMILPRWYTEGLAVYTESALSGDGGRLSSQFLQGLARSLTLDDQWEKFPLSDLNDGHRDWLGGARAYLFGGILWDSIARDGGQEVIYKMNQSYSRRLPFLLDGVLEDQLGRDYNQQLDRAYSFWKLRSAQQIEKISAQGQPDGNLITKDEGLFYFPSISPDGLWMIFLSSDLEGSGHIYLSLRHPKNGFRGYKPKKILSNTSAQSLAWYPTATGFVYEKLGRYKWFNSFYDLYYYDLRTKKSQRLTTGQRAHHPCFSPKGDQLYFLQNTPESKQIIAMDWETKNQEVLYKGATGDDLRFLTCPDKNSLLFIEHKPGKKPHIARFKLKSKKKTVAFNKYPVKSLKLTRRGALFSSDQSGVENLYLLNKRNIEKPQAITNTLSRALNGELDPFDDSLYFSQLTSSGPKIFHLKGAQWESLPDTPPKIEPIVNFQASFTDPSDRSQDDKKKSIKDLKEKSKDKFLGDKEPRKPAQSNQQKYQASDFSPWRYLYPNYWIPFLYLVDQGTIFQALTSAGDPLGINTISIIGQWDTLTRKAGGSLSYTNRSLPVTLGAGVSDFYSYFYATGDSLHFSNASALASYRFESLDYARLLFKWNYSSLTFTNNSFVRQGPQAEISYRSYDSFDQNRNDVSTSSGWRFQLGHKNYLADLGSVAYGETYAHLGSFWSSFTPKRHVFYLGLNGSYAPKLSNSFFATSTLAGPFFNPQITNTSFLQRGYPTGNFLARNIVNANAEYRFPIFDIFSGWTAPPFFLKNLEGAFVFDATTLDGRYNNSITRSTELTEFGRFFTGYGLELETKVSMGFHVPVAFTLGLYYGEEQESFGGFTTFFNIRL